ncbi:MAG: peptidylprolyl isomerase [Balneolaceae bacterium]
METKATHLFSISALLAIGVFGLFSCSQSPDVQPDGIVAQVGEFPISDDHFRNELIRLYMRTGQALNINPELRRTVVDSRLDRYSMVSFAKAQGWHETPEARHEEILIERKVTMEAFQELAIHSAVEVTERDLRTLFYRVNTTLRASHLFATHLEEAKKLTQRLDRGESFESLAAEVFRNPSLANSGGDLGWFTVDEMDVAFEDAAYQLEVGEISGPIKTSLGYSIIRLTDRIETPIITESEFNSRRDELAQIAEMQKKELAVREHMRQIMEALEPNEAMIETLWEMAAAQPTAYAGEQSSEQLFPGLTQQQREEPLFSHPFFTFTVGDLIHEAFYTPAQRREQAVERWIFEEQLAGMAYRRYALEQAVKHPDFDPHYTRRAIEETFYSYLIETFNEYVDRQVHISEVDVRYEFQKNREYYDNPLELNVAEMIITSAGDAEYAMQRLNNGEPFQSVLEAFTADRDAVEYGGELGFIPIHHFGQMAPQLQGAEPGDVAGPFQLQSNHFVIFQILDRKESTPATFAEARPYVEEAVRDEKTRQLKRELIEQAKNDFNAVVYTDRLNTLPIEL